MGDFGDDGTTVKCERCDLIGGECSVVFSSSLSSLTSVEVSGRGFGLRNRGDVDGKGSSSISAIFCVVGDCGGGAVDGLIDVSI